MSGYKSAIIISISLHLLLIIAVVWGWESASETKKTYKPRYIEAKLVQLKAKTSDVKKSRTSKKTIDLTKKRREQERLHKQQAEKKYKLALAKKKADHKDKLRKDKLRKEKERKAREKKARQEQQRKQQEQALDQALQEEEDFLEAESQAETAQSYTALMVHRIEQNWSRPPSARRGMTCKLSLHLVPTGAVVDVSVLEGSGNSAFDRSAEQAVRRVGRFEELQGMPPEVFERYFRQLTLIFNPQDLRL